MKMIINRLFSSFDPLLNTFSLNLTSIFIPCLLLCSFSFFFIKPRFVITIFFILNFLINEIKASVLNKHIKGKIIILIILFYFILLLNLTGLFPYVFTITAHIALTFSLALRFWLSFLIMRLTKNTKLFLAHLVPLGTPITLSQFIRIIERVSLLIRPITLSVRLAANITAGHILIALCRSPILFINSFSTALLLLVILEIAVAFIQAYVFVTLLSIYLRETYETKSPLPYSIH